MQSDIDTRFAAVDKRPAERQAGEPTIQRGEPETTPVLPTPPAQRSLLNSAQAVQLPTLCMFTFVQQERARPCCMNINHLSPCATIA